MLSAGLKHLHNKANVLVLVLKSFVKLKAGSQYDDRVSFRSVL